MAEAARTVHVAGHFGEMLQGRLGPDGPVVLVTLPCPVAGVTARWTPAPGLFVHTPERLIAPAGVRAIARALGRAATGRLHLRASVPPGGGCGVSTATRVAVARVLAGGPVPPDFLARLALALEGASDPLMYPAPGNRLWASRLGVTLALLPAPPALDVVGGHDGPAMRTDAADTRFADISDLLPLWAEAADARDAAMLGALATASAERNTALRGGPPLKCLRDIAARHGALGIAAAHTGSARALLFAPGAGTDAAARDLYAAGLRRILRFRAPGDR